MTLIAGFRSFGTPTLIGDFLITTGDAVAGLRKKVLIVADNFALAWTGHLLAADSVVKSLQSYLDLDAVQIEAVRAILTNRTTSDLGTLHVSLICWVIDNQGDHCFRWNSQDPNKVRWGAPMYDGSGESFVEALVGGGLRDSFKPTSIDPDRTVDGALDVTTKLMVSEMLGPSTHPHGFGFAYEIIQGKSHRFEYVDNILYFAVTHELDDTGKHFSSHFAGSIYKYQSHENYTLINVYDPSKNAHNVHVVSPVGQESKETLDTLVLGAERSDYLFPFSSQYYCVFIRFNAPDFESPPLVLIQGNHVPQNDRIFEVTAKKELLLHVKPAMIEWMYRTIREDQARKTTT